MSRGPSGRLVVELEPDLKHELYVALSSDGLTFKDWLTGQVERYISEQRQPLLIAAEPQPATYGRATHPNAKPNGEKEDAYGRRKTKYSRSR